MRCVSIMTMLALSLAAYSQSVAAPLTAEALVQAFRERNSLAQLKNGLGRAANERASAASFRLAAPPRLSVETEIAPPAKAIGNEEESTAGSASVRLQQEITLGVDAARATARFSALARAETLERSLELAEQEKEVVLSFVALREEAAVHEVLTGARADLSRIAETARRAAQLGTLSALTATQAELLTDQFAADLDQSLLTFAANAELLANVTGLPVPNVPDVASLGDLSSDVRSPREVNVEELPALQATRLKLEALAAERDALLSRRSMEVGLGVSRAFGDKRETSILAEVGVPLGVGAAARSEAAALDGERAAADAEAVLARQRIAREAAKLKSELARAEGAVRRTTAREQRLAEQRQKIERAFRNGQAEISEVLEVVKEHVESRLEAARERAELESALVARSYLFRVATP